MTCVCVKGSASPSRVIEEARVLTLASFHPLLAVDVDVVVSHLRREKIGRKPRAREGEGNVFRAQISVSWKSGEALITSVVSRT